jgi:phenylacetic acid degradation operon negative regulatory protein
MRRRGFLQSRRDGRHSFYRLTDRGLKEVRGGSDRAFGSPHDKWDGHWTLVTYSVPEKHRQCRDALRRSLNWYGFGALAPGIWISPRVLRSEAEEKWRKLGVWEYLEVFGAKHLGPSDEHNLVDRAWPHLSVLAGRYQSYLAKYEPILHLCQAGELDDEACFAIRLQSLFEFVAIALDDPGLPLSLLPGDWPRPRAQSLFDELRQGLAKPAECFFDAICTMKGDT